MSAKFNAAAVLSVYERMAALVNGQEAKLLLGMGSSGVVIQIEADGFTFTWGETSHLHASGINIHGYVIDRTAWYAALSLYSLMHEPTCIDYDPRREDLVLSNRGLTYRIPAVGDASLVVPACRAIVSALGSYMRPAFGAASFCESGILEIEDDAIVLSARDGDTASYFKAPAHPDKEQFALRGRRTVLGKFVLAAGMIATTDMTTRRASGDVTIGYTSENSGEDGCHIVFTAGNWSIHGAAIEADEPTWPSVMPETYASRLTAGIDDFVSAASLVSRAAQTSRGVFEMAAAGNKLRFSVILGRKRICEHEIDCAQDGAFDGRIMTIPTDRVVGFVHAPSGFRSGSEVALLKGGGSEYVLEVSGEAECLIRVA